MSLCLIADAVCRGGCRTGACSAPGECPGWLSKKWPSTQHLDSTCAEKNATRRWGHAKQKRNLAFSGVKVDEMNGQQL